LLGRHLILINMIEELINKLVIGEDNAVWVDKPGGIQAYKAACSEWFSNLPAGATDETSRVIHALEVCRFPIRPGEAMMEMDEFQDGIPLCETCWRKHPENDS
jgi:nitrite reductase/ring-hydroxylating ferredoxin subunit